MITKLTSSADRAALEQPCDACGQPLAGVHITDDEVCRGTDRPGYYLCGRAACPASRAYALGYSTAVRAALYVRRPRPVLAEPPPLPHEPHEPSEPRDPRLDALVADLEAVCSRHGCRIAHEDGHGSGLVQWCRYREAPSFEVPLRVTGRLP